MPGEPLTVLFNLDAVCLHLGLNPKKAIERDAVAFVYRHFSEGEYRADTRRVAIDDTIDWIQDRYEMLKDYCDSFFGGENYDYNALFLAVVCDDLVEEANNFTVDENGDHPETDDKDFNDDRAISMAQRFFEEATDLNQIGLLENEDIREEAVFLAHLNAILDIWKRHDSFDEFDNDELEFFEKDYLAPARSYIRLKTDIGAELSNAIESLDSKLQGWRNKSTILKPDFNIARKDPFTGDASILNLPPWLKLKAEPVEHLLDSYHLPKEQAVRGAVSIIWNKMRDIHDRDFDDTLEGAQKLLTKRTEVFSSYIKDFTMTDDERETALCAWLVLDLIDIKGMEYQDFISDKVYAILQTLEQKNMRYPVPSQSFNDKPLELCIGLSLIMQLQFMEQLYIHNRNPKYTDEQRSHDLTHCQRIIEDIIILDNALLNEIKSRSLKIFNTLNYLEKRRQFFLIKPA